MDNTIENLLKKKKKTIHTYKDMKVWLGFTRCFGYLPLIDGRERVKVCENTKNSL